MVGSIRICLEDRKTKRYWVFRLNGAQVASKYKQVVRLVLLAHDSCLGSEFPKVAMMEVKNDEKFIVIYPSHTKFGKET